MQITKCSILCLVMSFFLMPTNVIASDIYYNKERNEFRIEESLKDNRLNNVKKLEINNLFEKYFRENCYTNNCLVDSNNVSENEKLTLIRNNLWWFENSIDIGRNIVSNVLSFTLIQNDFTLLNYIFDSYMYNCHYKKNIKMHICSIDKLEITKLANHLYLFKNCDDNCRFKRFILRVEADEDNPALLSSSWHNCVMIDEANYLLPKFPDNVVFLRYILVKYQLFENDYSNVIKNATFILNKKKYMETMYLKRGYSYLQLEEYDKALYDLNQFILLNSKYSAAYYYRALAKYGLGRVNKESALADLDIAKKISLENKNYDIYKECIRIYNIIKTN